jgi:hypothetical protein
MSHTDKLQMRVAARPALDQPAVRAARGEVVSPRAPHRTHLTDTEVINVKLSCTADELSDMEGLDDAALAKVVRDALKGFRGRDSARVSKDNELENANPGTPSHTGPSTSTLETPASRAAHDSALQRHEQGVQQDEADRNAEKLIPNYRRLR